MGGLIVRYALTKMEHNNIDHKTKLFVSMDSPQMGANVPLGFQFMVDYLNNLTGGLLKDQVDKALNSSAAKEMLLYHYQNSDVNGNHLANCSGARSTFVNSLSGMGNFPQKPVTMAISMGSGTGTNQGFDAGATLINKYSAPISTLNLLLAAVGLNIPLLDVVKLEFKANAIPNYNTQASVFSHSISANICIPKVKIKILWTPLPLPIILPYLDCHNEIKSGNNIVKNTYPIDNAPGSIRMFHNLKDFGLSEILTHPVFTNIVANINTDQNNDCFIPSYSALGLNLGTAPHTHVKNYLNNQSGITQLTNNFYKNDNPNISLFDYLYIEDNNDFHIYDMDKKDVFSAEMIQAMEEMISPEYLYLKDRTINNGETVEYEAIRLIEVDGNFVVNPGGTVIMNSGRIVLKPGFNAKAGSTLRLSSGVGLICE